MAKQLKCFNMKKGFKKLVLGIIALFLIFGGLVLPKDDKPISPFVEHEKKQPPQKLLKIALLADSHNSWENLEKAVEQVNQEDFNFVIFLGDLTSVGSPDEFKKGKEILEDLKLPFYIVPGNHDVWYARKDAKAHDFYFDQVFSSNFPSCLEKDSFDFILIDNSNEQKGIGESDWYKLESCLQKNLESFVFLHEPVYHPASERVMGQYAAPVASQAAQLKQLFCDKKVKLVVAGHLHSFSKYFYDCEDGYKLPIIVVGALTTERNFQSPRFLQLDIFEDGRFEEKEIVLKN